MYNLFFFVCFRTGFCPKTILRLEDTTGNRKTREDCSKGGRWRFRPQIREKNLAFIRWRWRPRRQIREEQPGVHPGFTSVGKLVKKTEETMTKARTNAKKQNAKTNKKCKSKNQNAKKKKNNCEDNCENMPSRKIENKSPKTNAQKCRDLTGNQQTRVDGSKSKRFWVLYSFCFSLF